MDIWVWVKFVACAVIIIIAGTKLTRYSDTIADKTGLGKTFVGILFLAVATSIPEMATEISAVRLVGDVDLALGDAFGSNLFNVVLLPVAHAIRPLSAFWSAARPIHVFALFMAMASSGVLAAGTTVRSERRALRMGWDALVMAVLGVLAFAAIARFGVALTK